jgi:hypothetical protein
MIRVGTVVGLMVLPGEDWKNAKVPLLETKETSTLAQKVAPPNEITPSSSTLTSNDSSVSHLQMLVENLLYYLFLCI